MQQLIVNLIVAAAFLFLARWLFRSFVSKRADNTPACSGCGTCEAAQNSSASGPAPVSAPIPSKK